MEGLIIYFLGWVIAACIFGAITKYISESKGYYGGFAWGFWLGLIGILVVGFRPTITKSEIERPLRLSMGMRLRGKESQFPELLP